MRTPITILFVLAGLACQPACTTVTPAVVAAQQASFDEGGQNSGVLVQLPDGFIVTKHFRERYNGLIKTYGREEMFSPSLTADAGMKEREDGSWFIDCRHFIYFQAMNAWRRANFQPANK